MVKRSNIESGTQNGAISSGKGKVIICSVFQNVSYSICIFSYTDKYFAPSTKALYQLMSSYLSFNSKATESSSITNDSELTSFQVKDNGDTSKLVHLTAHRVKMPLTNTLTSIAHRYQRNISEATIEDELLNSQASYNES